MKIAFRFSIVLAMTSLVTFVSQAEPRQITQGTQVHLKLLSDVSTASSRNGDSFIAVTTEPILIGNELMLPAGTRIRGIVTSISPRSVERFVKSGGLATAPQPLLAECQDQSD